MLSVFNNGVDLRRQLLLCHKACLDLIPGQDLPSTFRDAESWLRLQRTEEEEKEFQKELLLRAERQEAILKARGKEPSSDDRKNNEEIKGDGLEEKYFRHYGQYHYDGNVSVYNSGTGSSADMWGFVYDHELNGWREMDDSDRKSTHKKISRSKDDAVAKLRHQFETASRLKQAVVDLHDEALVLAAKRHALFKDDEDEGKSVPQDDLFSVDEDALKWIFGLRSRSEREDEKKVTKLKKKAAVVKKRAMKRLFRDLKELQLHPLEGIAAGPVYDDNFLEWHVNLKAGDGPFYNTSIHIVMNFPNDYPASPPLVEISGVSLPHRHIYREWICLDMLEPHNPSEWYHDLGSSRGSKKNVEYKGGWSSGYSVAAILVQLQSFVFDTDEMRRVAVPPKVNLPETRKHVEQNEKRRIALAHNGRIDAALGASRKFKCPCGHFHLTPKPQFDRASIIQSKYRRETLPALTAPRPPAPMHQPHGKIPVFPSPKRKGNPSSSTLATSPQPSNSSGGEEEEVKEGDNDTTSVHSVAGGAQKKGNKKANLSPKKLRQSIPARGSVIVGEDVKGVVVRVEDYGAFVAVGLPRDGLVHVSQLRNSFVENAADVVHVGQKLTVKVMAYDPDARKLSLSLKQAQVSSPPGGPTDDMKGAGLTSISDLKVGDVIDGRVHTIQPFNVYIDIGCGRVQGRLSVKEVRKMSLDLVWDPAELLSEGDSIKVVVVNINLDKKTVSLRAHDTEVFSNEERKQAFIKGNEKAICDRNMLKQQDTREKLKAVRGSGFRRLCGDEMLHLLSFLNQADLNSVSRTCHFLQDISDNARSRFWIQQDLFCFFSRRSFRKETLGLAVNLEHYDNGDLSNVVPMSDIISFSSFHLEKVRKGVWNDKFTHWMPLYINSNHAKNLILHERCIADMCRNSMNRQSIMRFKPSMALKVLPSLMNTMVVRIMEGSAHESMVSLQSYVYFYHLLLAFAQKYPEIQDAVDERARLFLSGEDGRSKRVCPNLGELVASLSISTVNWSDILLTYLEENFDRNVKWVIKAYPELVDVAISFKPIAIGEQSKSILDKYEIPDHDRSPNSAKNGEKLPRGHRFPSQRQRRAAEAASKAAAKATAEAAKVTSETIEQKNGDSSSRSSPMSSRRNSSSSATSSGSSGSDKKGAVAIGDAHVQEYMRMDSGRLPKTFQASKVSIRLLLFHNFFLRHFRNPDGVWTSTGTVKSQLDACYGQVSHTLQVRFQAAVKRIKNVKQWNDVFRLLHIRSPSLGFLCSWFKQAAINSARRRYHNPDRIRREREAERLEARRLKREQESKRLELGLGEDDLDGDNELVLAALREEYSGADSKSDASKGGKGRRRLW